MPEGQNGEASAPSNESLENILSEFPSEGDQLESEEGAEDEEKGGNASESQSEKKVEKTPPSREENKGDDKEDEESELPFHKHPRFTALTQKNRELEEKLDKATQLLEQLQTGGKKEEEESASKSEAPKWFKAMYGDDPELWTEFKDYSQKQQQQIKEKVLEDIKKNYQDAQSADEQARKWVTDQLQSLHDDGLDFKDKELIQVLDEYRPMGDDGNLSFRKAYDILEKLKQANAFESKDKVKAKKEAATKVTSGGNATPPSGKVDMNRIHQAKDIHSLIESE